MLCSIVEKLVQSPMESKLLLVASLLISTNNIEVSYLQVPVEENYVSVNFIISEKWWSWFSGTIF